MTELKYKDGDKEYRIEVEKFDAVNDSIDYELGKERRVHEIIIVNDLEYKVFDGDVEINDPELIKSVNFFVEDCMVQKFIDECNIDGYGEYLELSYE